jgi:hypothetical protein
MPDNDVPTTEIQITADNELLRQMLQRQYGKMAPEELRAALETTYVSVWNEDEFKVAFTPKDEHPPYVTVTNNATGETGTVIYVDSPRFYFLFNPEIPPNE